MRSDAMLLENSVKNAYDESTNGKRSGDTVAELECIREYILAAREIVVPNRNDLKITAINKVLEEFGLAEAKHLRCDTTSCDMSRMPSITKALMGLDISRCDLVIARGRLGIPGSGSMLVIMDSKGRILTAGLSPSHVIHGKPVEEAVRDECTTALERVGFQLRGKTRDIYERT